MKIDIYFDGACNNHLEEALMGVGLVMYVDGETVLEKSAAIGKGSSNIAEWYGCTLAFKAAYKFIQQVKKEDPKAEFEVTIYSDSQLIVNQFLGHYMLKKAHFIPYYQKAKDYAEKLGSSFKALIWIPRTRNKEADKLSKVARISQEYALSLK